MNIREQFEELGFVWLDKPKIIVISRAVGLTYTLPIVATKPNPLLYTHSSERDYNAQFENHFGIICHNEGRINQYYLPVVDNTRKVWHFADASIVIDHFKQRYLEYDRLVQQTRDQLTIEDFESILSI